MNEKVKVKKKLTLPTLSQQLSQSHSLHPLQQQLDQHAKQGAIHPLQT